MTETVAVIRYTKAMTKPVQCAEDFGTLLEAHRQELIALIPGWSGLAWAHVLATACEVAAENPYIYQCGADSVLRSVKTACEFGLSFAKAGGQAYLVPFKGQCTLIIGYRGLMDLARRSADVLSFQSGVVYKGDKYEVHLGSDPHIIHIPDPSASHDDKNIVATYSVAQHASGRQSVEHMPVEEIKVIRARSRSRQKDGTLVGPWVTDFPPMARKTAIHRHMKYIGWKAEDRAFMERVMAYDNATDGIDTALANLPTDRLARMRKLLAGDPDIIEGEVVQPKAEGVPPSTPPATDPPALDPLVAARKHLGELAERLAASGRAKGKKTDADKVLAYATKQALGDSMDLDELSLDQAILVREWLESQKGSEP